MVTAIFLLSYMPYLMRITKVIRSAQLLGKDQAKLSHMIAAVPALVFISTCGVPGGTFNICTIQGYWTDRKTLMNNLCLHPGVLLPNFSWKVLNILPISLLGDILIYTEVFLILWKL